MLRILLLGDDLWLDGLQSAIKTDKACEAFRETSLFLSREAYGRFHDRHSLDDVDLAILFSASDLATADDRISSERTAFLDAIRLLLDADIPVFLCGRLSTCLQAMSAFSSDVQKYTRLVKTVPLNWDKPITVWEFMRQMIARHELVFTKHVENLQNRTLDYLLEKDVLIGRIEEAGEDPFLEELATPVTMFLCQFGTDVVNLMNHPRDTWQIASSDSRWVEDVRGCLAHAVYAAWAGWALRIEDVDRRNAALEAGPPDCESVLKLLAGKRTTVRCNKGLLLLSLAHVVNATWRRGGDEQPLVPHVNCDETALTISAPMVTRQQEVFYSRDVYEVEFGTHGFLDITNPVVSYRRLADLFEIRIACESVEQISEYKSVLTIPVI